MLSISESQMVVFFYISVEYSRIYKRKMARGKLNIDIRDAGFIAPCPCVALGKIKY
jgi:hypothetical protein